MVDISASSVVWAGRFDIEKSVGLRYNAAV